SQRLTADQVRTSEKAATKTRTKPGRRKARMGFTRMPVLEAISAPRKSQGNARLQTLAGATQVAFPVSKKCRKQWQTQRRFKTPQRRHAQQWRALRKIGIFRQGFEARPRHRTRLPSVVQ